VKELKGRPILAQSDDGVFANIFLDDGKPSLSVLNPEKDISGKILHFQKNSYCSEMLVYAGCGRELPFGDASIYSINAISYINSIKKNLLHESSCNILQIIYDKNVIGDLRYDKYVKAENQEIKTSDKKIIIRTKSEQYLEEDGGIVAPSRRAKHFVVECEKGNGKTFSIEEINQIVFNSDARLSLFHKQPVSPIEIQSIEKVHENNKDSIIRSNLILPYRRKIDFKGDSLESYAFDFAHEDLRPIDIFSGDILEQKSPAYIWRAFSTANTSDDTYLENRIYYLLVAVDLLFSASVEIEEKNEERAKDFDEFIRIIKTLKQRFKKVFKFVNSEKVKNDYINKDAFEEKIKKVFAGLKDGEPDFPKKANEVRNDLMHRGMIENDFYKTTDLNKFMDWLVNNTQDAIIRHITETGKSE